MNVLSVGEVSYDITVPVEAFPTQNSRVLLKEKLEYSGGPACNVAYLLNKWKCETYFSGVIGFDDYGTAIRKDLENNRIHVNYLETNYEKKTTMSLILIDKSNTLRTELVITPEVHHLKKYDYNETYDVIYSDGFEYSASLAVFDRNQNAITLLGASLDKGSDEKEILGIAKHVKYITFSLEFAEKITKMQADFNNPQTLLNIYRDLKNKYPNPNIIVTLKNMGAMYQLNNEIKVMPTISVTEVDRTGAGDIFDGALCYALGKHYDLEKAIRIANIAAGLSTAKYGVKDAMPSLTEVISYYEQRFGPLEVENNNVNVASSNQPESTPSNNQQPPTPPVNSSVN